MFHRIVNRSLCFFHLRFTTQLVFLALIDLLIQSFLECKGFVNSLIIDVFVHLFLFVFCLFSNDVQIKSYFYLNGLCMLSLLLVTRRQAHFKQFDLSRIFLENYHTDQQKEWDRLQVLLLLLSKFKQINFYSPPKSSGNLFF